MFSQFPIDASSIDKSLPVPVGTQLHGLLSYVLSHGEMAYGTKLPSVRQLAADLGIAPMTVSQVYQELRDDGLIEMKRGLGAFTGRDPYAQLHEHLPTHALRADIEALIGKAEHLGISATALVSMVAAQAQLRKPRTGLNIVFCGIFVGPTQDYVEDIKPVLAPDDTVRIVTLEQLQASEAARAICAEADVVLTFVHRDKEVQALVKEARILALRFIPSEKTRQALASLDPRTRVAAVTHFKDYIAIMRPSIREFAPHVADIRVTWSAAPDVAEVVEQCDAVIYATGADDVANLARPGVRCFEYRHAPDQGALHNVLVPYLAHLRRTRLNHAEGTPARKARAAGN
ncbi:MAG TPA: GntR family transcriptional regulator [Devosiaceae bacterium]|jgi:DNA-binding transcriptional regulator YhcF (GntR family)